MKLTDDTIYIRRRTWKRDRGKQAAILTTTAGPLADGKRLSGYTEYVPSRVPQAQAGRGPGLSVHPMLHFPSVDKSTYTFLFFRLPGPSTSMEFQSRLEIPISTKYLENVVITWQFSTFP